MAAGNMSQERSGTKTVCDNATGDSSGPQVSSAGGSSDVKLGLDKEASHDYDTGDLKDGRAKESVVQADNDGNMNGGQQALASRVMSRVSSNGEHQSSRLDDSDSRGNHIKMSRLGSHPWVLLSVGICLVLTVVALGVLVGGQRAGWLNLSSNSNAAASLNSSLAAANWTISNGTTIYVVIKQDRQGFLSAFASQDGVVATVNISQIFEDSGGLGILAGTPLAAVAISNPNDFADRKTNQLRVYYLTPSFRVTELVTYSPSLQEWHRGELGSNEDVDIITGPGSRIAATWQRCSNSAACGEGGFALTFEDDKQNVVVANSSANWSVAVASTRISNGSSLALISMDYNGSSDYVWNMFTENGIMGSAWQDYTTDWHWDDTGEGDQHIVVVSSLTLHLGGVNIMSDISFSDKQQFAATSFRDRQHAFIAAVYPGGNVLGNHFDPALESGQKKWEGNWHGSRQLNLVESPEAGFETIAMTADSRFYGLASDGRVWEYAMAPEDPYTFQFMDKIPRDEP